MNEHSERVERAIRDGTIDTTHERAMPPTDVFTGRTYHGLPDAYPTNKDGFVESQAAAARLVVYRGISDGSQWHLTDGSKLELWPGGAVFNEYGTLCGYLEPASWVPLDTEEGAQ